MDDEIWRDQHEFNRTLRPDWPTTYAERTALTKEMVLHLISECDELLRASGAWKAHRRVVVPENRAQILAELTDIRKYWITVAQIWGFSEEELDAAYWRKSAVVRQRYAEEWIHDLVGPMVILDMDNVLCDYPAGLVQWIETTPWQSVSSPDVLARLARGEAWINEDTLGCSSSVWRDLKHAFRTSGAKRMLPARPRAAEFTRWCKDQGWKVIILTSRPIDQYPTLLDDTVHWLNTNAFAYDYVWWAFNKGAALNLRGIEKQVVFAVDDEDQFIQEYSRLNIRAYHMCRTVDILRKAPQLPGVLRVTTLGEIMSIEGGNRGQTD